MSTPTPYPIADTRTMLTAMLAGNRGEIAELLDGVSEEQARARLVPSLTTLLGLVRHAAFVERVWLQVVVGGRTRAEVGLPETVDESFTPAAGDTVASVLGDFHDACAESDAILAAHDLDAVFQHRRGPVSLRWIYVHLIEEFARHAGHGDIIKEQLLSTDPAPLAKP